ncbi:hypothetical protein, partial [Oleiphilus sp. HI0061]
YAFPYRYIVNWYVQKTHGRVKQDREITFKIFQISELLKALVGATPDKPSLYTYKKNKKDVFCSKSAVNSAVKVLWPHFIKHYTGFRDLENLAEWQRTQEQLSRGKNDSELNKTRERLLLIRSQDQWDNMVEDINLRETYRRCREEWPLVSFYLEGSSRKKEDWVSKYKNRKLEPEWIQLLDKNLSPETKEWLLSLSDSECRTGLVAKLLMQEIMEDTIYPSPHSFRHMWAEAVYRRFDGDAGWMIRSQFKHIAKRMWLAYIRNKDNRSIHRQVKQQVISSLVANFIQKQGNGYAGKFHKWLKRLMHKTVIMN